MPTLEQILHSHALHLVGGIGALPLGSPNNQTTADYIADTCQRLGLEVEQQSYPCTAWAPAAPRPPTWPRTWL